MFVVVTFVPEGKSPDAIRSVGMVSVFIFEPCISALLLMSSLTIVPSTMFALATLMPLGNVPVAIFV